MVLMPDAGMGSVGRSDDAWTETAIAMTDTD
jgi:hypothetical protein